MQDRLVVQKFGDQIIDDTVLLEPEFLDTAAIAVSSNRVVYGFEDLVSAYVCNTEMSREEACEWISFNTIRGIPYMGNLAPLVVEDFNPDIYSEEDAEDFVLADISGRKYIVLTES